MAAVTLPLTVACAVSYVIGPLAATFGETAEYAGIAAWLVAFIGAGAGALAACTLAGTPAR